MQNSVLARQKPPHPVGSSGSGAHRQTGTTSSNRATQTSPWRHWLHVLSNNSRDTLLNRKWLLPLFVRRTTWKGIRPGREEVFGDVTQLHGLISTAAAETVDPAVQDIKESFDIMARLLFIFSTTIWSGVRSLNKHRRLRDCARKRSHEVRKHSGVHSVHRPQLATE